MAAVGPGAFAVLTWGSILLVGIVFAYVAYAVASDLA